ncbi:MAG: oligopeptide/dipeptide ABC transporter ATP-binding protein [Eubacteriales bacterium]
MPNTKKLLSITNLKKYFPVAQSSFFRKKRRYVRANEDISLDIYEGETLGVVGESGCGKSTLGRVLLQLYSQTAGNTVYYGKTLKDLAPDYVNETLTHLPKYRKKYNKCCEKVAGYEKKVADVGGEENADFYLLQDYNLAKCEQKTALDNIVKIIGGFFAVEDTGVFVPAFLKLFRLDRKMKALKSSRDDLRMNRDHLSQLLKDAGNPNSIRSKIATLDGKISGISEKIAALSGEVQSAEAELDQIRSRYADSEEFRKYEAMRDEGVDLSRLKYHEMRLLRKDLQIIFQDPYSSLNPRFTIANIIEEGLVTHKFYKHGSPLLRNHIVNTMVECGLQEYMLHRYPHQFSGGQRQRISIARALAVHPKFIVCDECVSALDVSIQSQIINLLQELKVKEKLTYLFISHDLSVVRHISDRICVMYLGNVVELADAETLFSDPRHPYTVALLSAIPTTDPDSLTKDRILLEGNIPSPIMPPSGCKFHTRCYMACEKCERVPPPLREIEPGHFVSCHFPEKKIDENGNYLFELPAMESKSVRVSDEKEA